MYQTRKKPPVRRPVFLRVYFITLIAAALLVIAAVILLNCALRDYENSLPQTLAERVFNENFRDADAERILSLAADALPPTETKEHLRSYLDERLASGGLSYNGVSAGVEEGSEKFVVTAGGEKLLSFTLTQTGKKSAFGCALYELDRIEYGFSSGGEISVLAPEGYTVSVNGCALGADYRAETGIDSEQNAHLPESVGKIMLDRYVVTGLLAEPVVTAIAPGGGVSEVTEKDDGNYEAAIVYDAQLQARHEELVLEAARCYAAYMQSDASFGRLSGYLDPDSELYEQTRTTATYFVIDHNGYDFADEWTGEYIAYDENTFSCCVKLTHLLHKSGKEDYREYLDLVLFFRNVGGEYLIFDRYNTN